MNEVFKPLDGPFLGYYISNLGNVYSRKTNKILKQQQTVDGYKVVSLSNGKNFKKTLRVHRLLLQTFDPRVNDENLTVNHINMDRTDNRLENLEWLSHAKNIKHSADRGKYRRFGVKNSRSKLSLNDVLIIRDLNEQGLNGMRINEIFYPWVTHRTVYQVLRGVTYAS